MTNSLFAGRVDVRVAAVNSEGVCGDVSINELSEGEAFGERALESEAALRTATITTSGKLTELLVISREDYRRLIQEMRERELAEQGKLLKRTLGLHKLSDTMCRDIGRYLEDRSYRVGRVICEEGTKATHMFLLARGEASLTRRISIKDGRSNTQRNTTFHLDRIGPGTLIAGYVAALDSFGDDALYKETVTATTQCQVFVLCKHDLFVRYADS
jgi:CRP-like cAMP-binding protein